MSTRSTGNFVMTQSLAIATAERTQNVAQNTIESLQSLVQHLLFQCQENETNKKLWKFDFWVEINKELSKFQKETERTFPATQVPTINNRK